MVDVTQLENIAVTVIGDLILDTFYHGKVTRFTPDAPVPVVKVHHVTRRLGGAANVANNLSSLGVKTAVVGFIGRDDNGRHLQRLLTQKTIRPLLIETGHPTITKMNVIGENIDGESQKMFRMDFEEDIDETHYTRALLDQVHDLMENSHALILSDYLKGVCTPEVCQTIIQLGKARHIPVIVDPKGRDWRKYARASFVKPNLKELSEAAGYEIVDDDSTILDAGRRMMEMYQIENLVVSRSANGLTHISQDEVLQFPSFAKEVIDVMGAGDALVATFAACFAAGHPVSKALELANHAAGIVCGKKGTEPIFLAELLYGQTSQDQNKVLDPQNVMLLIQKLRTERKKIVFTNGCFDIIHKGHIEHLRQAKALGDVLIIGLNSDASIRRLKGVNRPINTFEDRVVVLQNFACVDYIIPFEEDTPTELIKTIDPDILVKGGNYRPEEVVGGEFAKAVKILPFIEGYSTANLLQSIRNGS